MRQYRVVVIDDDVEVLRRVEGRISLSKREFAGKTWQIDLALVRVEIEEDGTGNYRFKHSTIMELGQVFTIKPDLLLVDYGYVDREVYDHWVGKVDQGDIVMAGDLAGQILTPVDLVSAVGEMIAKGGMDSSIRNSLRQNLIGFDGPLVLYTMTSKALVAALGEAEDRRSRTATAFPLAEVTKIDTKYELYNREEFVSQKHDSGLYAHLVGGLIDKEIQIGLLWAMLTDARYLRFRRSVMAIGAIVAIGGGFAAVAEFIGNRIAQFLQSGEYANAALVGVFAIVMVFAVGMLLPLAFGRVMSGLLGRNKGPFLEE